MTASTTTSSRNQTSCLLYGAANRAIRRTVPGGSRLSVTDESRRNECMTCQPAGPPMDNWTSPSCNARRVRPLPPSAAGFGSAGLAGQAAPPGEHLGPPLRLRGSDVERPAHERVDPAEEGVVARPEAGRVQGPAGRGRGADVGVLEHPAQDTGVEA